MSYMFYELKFDSEFKNEHIMVTENYLNHGKQLSI